VLNHELEKIVQQGSDVVRTLDSPTLYQLEQAGQVAREVLDERIVEWTQAGWSQRQIAEEMGCSHQAVSKRQARLGIESRNEWRQASPGGGGNRVATPQEPEEEVTPDLVIEPMPSATEVRDLVRTGQTANLPAAVVEAADRPSVQRAGAVHDFHKAIAAVASLRPQLQHVARSVLESNDDLAPERVHTAIDTLRQLSDELNGAHRLRRIQ
jgi:hypothetical protein